MTSVRQIYIIKADNPKIGRIAVIEIGMAEVSGIVSHKKTGDKVAKGELLGGFRFGGSSHAIIFDKDAKNLTFSPTIQYRMQNDETKVWESILQPVNSPLAWVEWGLIFVHYYKLIKN